MAERYLNTSLNINDLEELKAKELNEITNKSTKFWLTFFQDWALQENMMWTLSIIQFCHANNAMLLVQLWINSTRDVWKFCQN